MDTADILKELTYAADTDPQPDEYSKTRDKLSNYFVPIRSTDWERYVFGPATQKPRETVDTYTRLQQLAVTYEFPDKGSNQDTDNPQVYIQPPATTCPA